MTGEGERVLLQDVLGAAACALATPLTIDAEFLSERPLLIHIDCAGKAPKWASKPHIGAIGIDSAVICPDCIGLELFFQLITAAPYSVFTE